MLVLVVVVFAQGVDVALIVNVVHLPQLIERRRGLIQREVEPRDVRSNEDVGKVATCEGSVEALCNFLVVGTCGNQFDLQIWVLLLELINELLLYVTGRTRVVGPEGDGVGVSAVL